MGVFIVIGIVVIGCIVGLVLLLAKKPVGEDLLQDRLGREEKKAKKEKQPKGGKRESVVGAAVDRAVAGKGFAQNLSTQLAQANLKWTVGEFLVMQFVIMIGASAVFYALNRPVLIAVAVAGGFFGPRIYVGMKKGKRLKEFNDQLGDALNLMVNSLRAGYSTMQAMEVISNEMPVPISEEFGRVVRELQLGVPFDTGMGNMLRRVPSPDMDLVVTAMNVQREVGGNLAEVLDSISFTIRERVRIKGEIKVMTSQGRITGYLITFIPFALGAFIYFVNPDFMGLLFTDPCGWIMLGLSLFLIVLGYFSISKIVNIEV
ncbi:MAG TPA: type II secretion system F family protein [Anaerolineae bacterium]|nr:type II secretion system F family protein [Anaerolineae bacterium]